MGRKQIVVLQALSKLQKPITLADLAGKGLKGDGRDEVYQASDLRSAYRRLSARGYVTITQVEVGEGDAKKKVDAAKITAEGKAALKEALNPTPKEKTEKPAAKNAPKNAPKNAEQPAAAAAAAAEGGSEDTNGQPDPDAASSEDAPVV